MTITVLAPPSEHDELSADPEFLKGLAEKTDGLTLTAKNFDQFLKDHLLVEEASIENGRVVWNPVWRHWLFACLLALVLGSEWWIRRRNGLL